MANSFTNFNPEWWSRDLQATLFTENSALMLAGARGSDMLSDSGRKFHIPITTKPGIQTYTPGSDLTDDDIVSSKETLEVDTFKALSAYIDDVEQKQSNYEHQSLEAMFQARILSNDIEQAFLGKVTDASHSIDGATFGSSGNLELNETNAVDLFSTAHTKLDAIDAPMGSSNRFAVVGANVVRVLRNTKAGRESSLGDSVLANGIVGPWQGWTVVQNNNLPFSAKLKIDAQPSEGDTVTIAGVVFTFKASPVSAGDVDIAAAATARANLKKAVEKGDDAGTAYIEVSAEDRFLLRKRGVAITDDEDMVLTGFGDITVSETLTDATNVWSEELQNSWFGVRGATDLIVQLPIRTETTRVEKRFGTRVKTLAGYGVKTFADGARVLINVKLDASSYR